MNPCGRLMEIVDDYATLQQFYELQKHQDVLECFSYLICGYVIDDMTKEIFEDNPGIESTYEWVSKNKPELLVGAGEFQSIFTGFKLDFDKLLKEGELSLCRRDYEHLQNIVRNLKLEK